MNEKEIWEKFCKGGKIADYIEYRNCVNIKNGESENRGENNGTGACGQRTDYR